MTQEEYDKLQERLNKGYDLRQSIARTERDLMTMLSARKENANYLPVIMFEWSFMYSLEWLVLSEDTTRKIMDLVTEDLTRSLETLKKEYEEL